MTRFGCRSFAFAVLWACLRLQQTVVTAKVIDPLPQGFLFDFLRPGEFIPIPTVAECETLPIKWSRGTLPASSPSASAPYTMQIFTSTFIVPFTLKSNQIDQAFNWSVPFVPGTQFQMCMHGANNVSGGCQDMYTVYAAPGSTPKNPPSCSNITFPEVLDVKAEDHTGTLSQFGWVDQCTDISLTPRNGTPPYTFTIAPALRTPYVVTQDSMDTFNWTVSLSAASSFFVSVVDAEGRSWSNGPLHSSSGGSTACLDTDHAATPVKRGISKGAIAGAAVGSLIAGIVAGGLAVFFFARSRIYVRHYPSTSSLQRKGSDGFAVEPLVPNAQMVGTSSRDGSMRQRSGPRQVEPYVLHIQDHLSHSRGSSDSTTVPAPTHPPALTHRPSDGAISPASHSPQTVSPVQHSPQSTSPLSMSPQAGSPTQPPSAVTRGPGQNSQIYVVHHDGGRPPPVTVYTAEGMEVVELPPQYESRAGPPLAQAQGRAGSPPGARRLPRLPKTSTESMRMHAANASQPTSPA